jgi:transcriptional regulator with XRE-family HTH domain
MSKEKRVLLPVLQRALSEMGENIRLSRLRRRFSTTMLAERAGISRATLYAIERGEPTVSLGAYASVLFVLGLEKDLRLIARDDVLGRKLQDLNLPVKVRAPRTKKSRKDRDDHE